MLAETMRPPRWWRTPPPPGLPDAPPSGAFQPCAGGARPIPASGDDRERRKPERAVASRRWEDRPAPRPAAWPPEPPPGRGRPIARADDASSAALLPRIVFGDQAQKVPARLVEPRPHRARRDVLHEGNFLPAVPFDLEEHECRSALVAHAR